MKNQSLKHSIFFAICFSFLAISFNSGCETTDFEPLIMKKKLREMTEKQQAMEKEISDLKAAVNGTAVTPKASKPSTVPQPTESKAEAVEKTEGNTNEEEVENLIAMLMMFRQRCPR